MLCFIPHAQIPEVTQAMQGPSLVAQTHVWGAGICERSSLQRLTRPLSVAKPKPCRAGVQGVSRLDEVARARGRRLVFRSSASVSVGERGVGRGGGGGI